jgi:hypothetical protein
MNRIEKMQYATSLFQARRQALGLPIGTTPTTIKDKTFYLNVSVAALAGGGQIRLTDSDTKKAVGVTNFDGNKLVKGRVLVMDAIRVRFSDVGATVQNASYSDAGLYKELQGGELRLVQNKEVLVDLPLSDLRGFNVDDYRELSNAPMIVDEAEFDWILELPKGVVVPENAKDGQGVFISIQVRCTEFYQA